MLWKMQSKAHVMLNAPESLKTATTQPVQVSETATHGQGKSDSPTSLVCDLAAAKAFCEDYLMPHVPVLTAFGGERLHVCRLNGSWDLKRAVAENASAQIVDTFFLRRPDATVYGKVVDNANSGINLA